MPDTSLGLKQNVTTEGNIDVQMTFDNGGNNDNQNQLADEKAQASTNFTEQTEQQSGSSEHEGREIADKT